MSDEADNQSSDFALSQAVSSITGERLPTIILSSPAKSPAKAPPAGSSSITEEETVQAVCCLQGADLNPLTGKIGEAVTGLPGLAIEENVQLSLAGDFVTGSSVYPAGAWFHLVWKLQQLLNCG